MTTTQAPAPTATVAATVWNVTTSHGRDYTITRPAFPRIFQLFVEGEYGGEYATLAAAVSEACDVGLRDDRGHLLPPHMVGRALSAPQPDILLPVEACEPDEWVLVYTDAIYSTALDIYEKVVGSLTLTQLTEGDFLTFKPGLDKFEVIARCRVPRVLVPDFTDKLLWAGCAVEVSPDGDVPSTLLVERTL